MTYDQFIASTSDTHPNEEYNPLLKALWYDAKDDWEHAHDIAQDIHSSEGAWIHAYLHRKEGDLSNARYWYRLAGKNEFKGELKNEWEQIVKTLIENDINS
ncbi:hypothetical protein [Catalinimonas niigatensis]|uniref:hypothetical protein n=1 Tax=Catalinimonas niigatensis TaxID=1397264 RepID=UPI00266507F5|nr:hypothetical protein [Catalinimonas niigatensis]WPP51072.1 hypothetical protein PZB72_01520 [Catalinimonas niigatensis]